MALQDFDVQASVHPLAGRLSHDLLRRLLEAAKPKERSITTHLEVHTPELAHRSCHCSVAPQCLLLGDSMFERFKTTGQNTILGRASLARTRLSSDQKMMVEGGVGEGIDVMNCGVGGDRIPNVVYRCLMPFKDRNCLEADVSRSQGLVEWLMAFDTAPRVIFVEIGTNDLKSGGKSMLSKRGIEEYRILIEALLALFPDTYVVVCTIVPRRAARPNVVENSNDALKKIVQSLENDLLRFLPTDPNLVDMLEDDGLHINVDGYKIFDRSLVIEYLTLTRPEIAAEDALTALLESIS